MILLNGNKIEPTIFPDKTSQVWKIDLPEFQSSVVEWRFESESEIVHLAQLKTILNKYCRFVTLVLPYLPYGRQDKTVSNENTFALLTFANLLNSMAFDEIVCFDPHSDVAKLNIKKFREKKPHKEILFAFNEIQPECICYPDDGAMFRYGTSFKTRFSWGSKVRNQSTGQIEELELRGENVKDKKVLIVDDICDGGATFIFLAERLYSAGASEVHLYVSHGLFTKGVQVLKDAGIKRIFTKEGELK